MYVLTKPQSRTYQLIQYAMPCIPLKQVLLRCLPQTLDLGLRATSAPSTTRPINLPVDKHIQGMASRTRH